MQVKSIYLLAMILCLGCGSDFENCVTTHTGDCSNEVGPFCTFGFKFGAQPSFSPAGLDIDGPGLSALGITYSFRNDGKKIDTEVANGVETFSFDEEPPCRIDAVQSALREWSNFANISFLQIDDNEEADIEFYIYDDAFSSRGTPNYQSKSCQAYGGRVMLAKNFLGDCNQYRILALHEIGHALGLGHVDSDNIMTSSEKRFQFDGLMLGDIEGIQSIYGVR